MDDKQSEIRERYLGRGVAWGMTLGVAIGAGFGVALGEALAHVEQGRARGKVVVSMLPSAT